MTQPDLNYRSSAVVDEMKGVLKFWLDKGVDGFRVDAIPHLFEVEKDKDGNYPDEPLSGDCTDDKFAVRFSIVLIEKPSAKNFFVALLLESYLHAKLP